MERRKPRAALVEELAASRRRERELAALRDDLAMKLRASRQRGRELAEERQILVSDLRLARDRARPASDRATGSGARRFVQHRSAMGNDAPMVLCSGVGDASWCSGAERVRYLLEFVESAKTTTPLGAPTAPLLITGMPRSGTSMLHGMLAGKAGFGAMRSEVDPLRALMLAAKRSIEHTVHAESPFFRDEAAAKHHFSGVVQGFLEASFPNEIPLLKQPRIATFVPLLHELVPDLRILVLVRDPRDVVASVLDWVDRTADAGRVHAFAGLSPRELASHLLEYLLPIIDLVGTGTSRVAMVPYQRLVSDPTGSIEWLEQRLDVPGQLMGRHMSWDVKKVGESSAVTSLYGQPPSASQVGRFRSRLDAEVLAVVSDVFAPMLETLGLQSSS